MAADALSDDDALRLMTLPGISCVTAIALLGVIGDVKRFRTSRQLVAALRLDPRVHHSGSELAEHGKISKQVPATSAVCSSKRPGTPPGAQDPAGRFISDGRLIASDRRLPAQVADQRGALADEALAHAAHQGRAKRAARQRCA